MGWEEEGEKKRKSSQVEETGIVGCQKPVTDPTRLWSKPLKFSALRGLSIGKLDMNCGLWLDDAWVEQPE